MYYAAGRGGGSSKAGSSSSVWSVEVVCGGGGGGGGGECDMDSVEEKNEEMGSLCTCFQGNRGLQKHRQVGHFILNVLHCPLAKYCRPL